MERKLSSQYIVHPVFHFLIRRNMPQRNRLYSHLKQPSSLCSLVFHIRLFLLASPGVSSPRRLGFQDAHLYAGLRIRPHKPSGEGAP